MNRTLPRLLLAAAAVAALSGCAPMAEPTQNSELDSATAEAHDHDHSHDHDHDHDHESEGEGESDNHGAVENAKETPEAPLHLVSIDANGQIGMLDLLSAEANELGRTPAPTDVHSDGRYVFASTEDGLHIIDSGMWSWSHGDHYHYYRGSAQITGVVEGHGPATVVAPALSTAGGTGVFFPDTGRAVLLDNAELSHGHIHETFSLETIPHAGLVAPLGEGALVTEPDSHGKVMAVRFHDPAGKLVEGAKTECVDAHGGITTAAGVVIGCADAAVVATMDGEKPQFKRIPYPSQIPAAERAVSFENRKGRPSVAAVAGDRGAWVLDVRQGQWQRILEDVSLLKVTAVDDELGHVVALDTAGRIHVHRTSSGERTVSEPLLDQTLQDVELLENVELVVDRERAYLSAPAEEVVHEIDFLDEGRIARTLETPTAPIFMAEVGR